MKFFRVLVLATGLFLLGVLTFVNADYAVIRPNAQGADNGWGVVGCPSESKWACISEEIPDVSNLLKDDGYSVSFRFSPTNLTDSNVFAINSVTVYYYARAVPRGTPYTCFIPYLRSGLYPYTHYAPNQQCVGAAAWVYKAQVYTTPPWSNSPWTVAEVNSLEAGMQSAFPYAKIAQVYAVVEYTPSNPPLFKPDVFVERLDLRKYYDNSTGNQTTRVAREITIKNRGGAPAPRSFAMIGMLFIFEGGGAGTAYHVFVPPLQSGHSYSIRDDYVCQGLHFVNVTADVDDNVPESNEQNNRQNAAIECRE